MDQHDKSMQKSNGTEWVYTTRYAEGEEVVAWIDHPVAECPFCHGGKHHMKHVDVLINCPLCTKGRLMNPKKVRGTVAFRTANITESGSTEEYDFHWEGGGRILQVEIKNQFHLQ